jgi:metal-responsive CopG/Arc/MetJ family transcriptional regulator
MNQTIKYSLHNEVMEAVDELMEKYFQVANKNEVCEEIARTCIEYCEQELPENEEAVITLQKLFENDKRHQPHERHL